jgi:hypothetical protein
MKIRSSPAIPSLVCTGVPLDGARRGTLIRIIDSDASAYINYVILGSDGVTYCTQMDAKRRKNRNALMRIALESARHVTVIGGINSYLRCTAVGNEAFGVVK